MTAFFTWGAQQLKWLADFQTELIKILHVERIFKKATLVIEYFSSLPHFEGEPVLTQVLFLP